MSISSIHEGLTPCDHSNHLFNQPLCQNQSLLKKNANVVFHILTLGIPLAFYHIVSSFPATPIEPKQKDYGNLQQDWLQKRVKPLPPVGQVALKFARKKLEENPDISGVKFRGAFGIKVHQPTNDEIAKLSSLHSKVLKNFIKEIEINKENTWENPEVLKAANDVMKITYAIGILTLQDLKPFTEDLSAQGEDRPYSVALTKQDSYQYRLFFKCPLDYHACRAGYRWTVNSATGEEGIFPPETSIPESHATPFYTKGTMQNDWNTLYNDYCDRVRMYVKEENLETADQRFKYWTKKDTGIKTFRSTRGTIPT